MIELIAHGKRGQAPPMLAIPGIDGSEGSILPLVQRLAQHRQVLVANYSRESNPTLEALTFEIAARVRKQAPGVIDMLGQSIGSIMAAQLAGLDALEVRRVVLVGAFTRARSAALSFSTFGMRLTPRPVYRWSSRLLMALVCGPVGDGRSHPFFAASRDSDPEGVRRRTRWQIRRDFSSDLGRIHQPLLVLLGQDDRFVPNVRKDAARFERLFEGRPFELVVLPHAGHVLLPTAAIERAVSDMERFLS